MNRGGDQPEKVAHAERAGRNGHEGHVIWLTGLSGAGKSTLSVALERRLFDAGHQTYVLDGDHVRAGLCSDLGFSPADRSENIRRVGEVARTLADAGVMVIVALISPFAADRARARAGHAPGRFTEVYVNAPLEVCEGRDAKGLYARARRHEIADFTGLTSPYEPPVQPDVEIRTDQVTVAQGVDLIWQHLQREDRLLH